MRARREALVYYLTSCYLPALVHARHHVLYTVPFADKTVNNKSHSHALTYLTFQLIPFMYGGHGAYVEGLYGHQNALFERNMIVFAGMVDGHTPPLHTAAALPRPASGACGNWVVGVGREIPHGSVCLSRRTFLEGRILSFLEGINAETTVLPAFSGVDEKGEWVLELTTWAEHAMKKNARCRWREVTSARKGEPETESLDFEWKNREEWTYHHEGDFGSGSAGEGRYSINCKSILVGSFSMKGLETK